MRIVSFEAVRSQWDAFAEASADGWFWHTTDWMDFTQEHARGRAAANRSFAILRNGDLLAICPVMVEEHPEVDGVARFRRFGYSGGPIPFPAMHADLTPKGRDEVVRTYVQTLAAVAGKEDVAYGCVRIPGVAPSYLTAGLPMAHPLLRYGFIDLPYLTRVIDLRRSEAELWKDVRKGAKADIRRADRTYLVRIWDRDAITAERFHTYQALHQKDAGRITRSQRTFDLMLEWVRSGSAVLAEAYRGERAVAFALIITFAHGAYYGSACRDPADADSGAAHLLQWEAMRWLKARGLWWYDVGLQWFGPVWFEGISAKDVAIAAFKRGFGGSTIPLLTAEYFYSPALHAKMTARRWDAFLTADAQTVSG